MNKKILLVEDNPATIDVIMKELEFLGYDCIVAEDGKKAVELSVSRSPDLIIMDIAMPGMDGSEAASVLRSDPKTKDIPIVFLTCLFTKQEEKVCGHLLGQNFFIAKPYDVNELLCEIEKRVNHSKA